MWCSTSAPGAIEFRAGDLSELDVAGYGYALQVNGDSLGNG